MPALKDPPGRRAHRACKACRALKGNRALKGRRVPKDHRDRRVRPAQKAIPERRPLPSGRFRPAARSAAMQMKTWCRCFVRLAVPPMAQSAAPNERGACKDDYKKFCAGIAPGHGIVACLNKQHAKLSATCRTVIDSRKH